MPPTLSDPNNAELVVCPSCGHQQAERLPKDGDRSFYQCPTCGTFGISGTNETLFELGTYDIKRAAIVTDVNGVNWLRPAGGTILPMGFEQRPRAVICQLCNSLVAPDLDAVPKCRKSRCGQPYCETCLDKQDPRLRCGADPTDCPLKLPFV